MGHRAVDPAQGGGTGGDAGATLEHAAQLNQTMQVLVQHTSYTNCFFADLSLFGVSDRTWVTLTTSDVGVCTPAGALTSPQQLSFQI